MHRTEARIIHMENYYYISKEMRPLETKYPNGFWRTSIILVSSGIGEKFGKAPVLLLIKSQTIYHFFVTIDLNMSIGFFNYI